MSIFAAIGRWFERCHRTSWTREGMRRIRLERRRQLEAEHWTAAHDDQHVDGQLQVAAECYFVWATTPGQLCRHPGGVPTLWPWHARWWKPKGPIRDLERAGALCLAEIDRRQRALLPTAHIARLLDTVALRLGLELEADIARADDESQNGRLW